MSGVVLVALIGAGLLVGILSGLAGIGGGVLIVPLLYFFYAHPGWTGMPVPAGIEAAVAHATSLFIILPTAARGVVTYHHAHRVAWRTAVPIGIGAVVGAVAGARLALGLPGELLKVAFGILLVGSAARLLWPGAREGRSRPRPALGIAFGAGIIIGFLSALLGVGGGIVAIPVLIHMVGLRMNRVAATSLAVIMFAAAAGVITYVVSGWGGAILPAGSIGYVHAIVGLPILAGSLVSVRWGAQVNQRLGAGRLRWLFALLFLAVGMRLIILNIQFVL